MKLKDTATLLVLLGAGALVACRDARPPAAGSAASDRSHTAVLGGFGTGPKAPAETEAIPPPPGLPRLAKAQVVRSGPDAALAIWLQDGNVMAARYTRAAGWDAAHPLEDIYGEDSDPQLASNGQGTAMAVWRHTVGSIQSLRYSRFDTSGWSVPDVMPGALPQPRTAGNAAPRLQMDAQGRVQAEWTSGFDPKETQTARYVPGQGWSHAEANALALAAPAAPAR
jgi:hypothetical protein